MKHPIDKAQYESLMKKLEKTAIISDGRRKIIIYKRRGKNANIPKN